MGATLAGCATEPGGTRENPEAASKAQAVVAGAVARPAQRGSVTVSARFVEWADPGAISREELRKLVIGGRGSASEDGPVLGTLRPEEAAMVLKKLAVLPGVKLVSSPRVTAAVGNLAKIAVGDEIRYPARWGKSAAGFVPGEFISRTIGVELEATSALEADGWLRVSAKPAWTEFDGFFELGALAPDFAKKELVTIGGKPAAGAESGALAPVFSVRELEATVRLRSGETVVLLAPGKKKVSAEGVRLEVGLETERAESRADGEGLVFVTATLPPEAAR